MLELSGVYTWLRQWSYTGVLGQSRGVWQCSLSDCSISVFSGLSWEFSSLWMRPWLRRSIHGSVVVSISLTGVFFLLLFSFYDCGRGRIQLSRQRPLPTTADGCKPPFRIKTSLSFPLFLTIKIAAKTTPALLREENSYLTVFSFSLAYRAHWHLSLLLFQNNGQEQDDKMWDVCFPNTFNLNRKAPGF